MIDKFIFWLEGIVEDDPLLDEVKNIVFWVCANGKYKYLELRGYEQPFTISSHFFRPLEAEFFDISKLFHSDSKVFSYRLKNMIEDAFFSNILKQQYHKRKIYLWYDNTLTFLFKV